MAPKAVETGQVSLFRSCTLCVQGSAQKQDLAEPPCRPPSLTLSVHGAREGPAPRAQVSSLWALPCPLPGVSNPLGGADTIPLPSSPGGITAADLVKPRAKRPCAAAARWRPGAGALLAVPAPAAPRPRLGLLRMESPGDPACTGRLPTAVGWRCAKGWLKSPCPPPPPLRGCRLAALMRLCPLPGVDAPILVAAAMPLWLPLPLPVAAAGGLGAGSAATPSWNGGRKSGEGAGRPLLASRSGSRAAGKGGARSFGYDPPSASLAALWRFC